MKTFYPIKKIAIALWISFLASCGQKANERSYRVMLKGLLSHSVPEKTVAAASADSQSLFLDAREKTEFDVSHIRQAQWVGYKSFDLSVLKAVPRDSPITVYCSIGYRSEKIAEKLQSAGFTSVSNLYGGIFEWVNQGHPVYSINGPTADVHAYTPFWGKWLRKGNKVYN